MIFSRRSKDPAERSVELLAALQEQHEQNHIHDIGLTSMPKHRRTLDELKGLGPGAVPALVAALSAPRADTDTVEGYVQDGVANDAAEALGAIGDARAVGPLMTAGKEYLVSAPQALAAFPEGIDALLAALDDPDEMVRAISLNGLSFAIYDRDRVVKAITVALSDAAAWVRKTAAQAALISEPFDPALAAALGRVMREDPDEKVRDMAEKAYGRLVNR